ncbi:MAG TPA: hypothetical protein VFZ34_13805 [Blastocatellia bacterium]|nr:hypothetical protein [Blastocatellia bacterium]
MKKRKVMARTGTSLLVLIFQSILKPAFWSCSNWKVASISPALHPILLPCWAKPASIHPCVPWLAATTATGKMALLSFGVHLWYLFKNAFTPAFRTFFRPLLAHQVKRLFRVIATTQNLTVFVSLVRNNACGLCRSLFARLRFVFPLSFSLPGSGCASREHFSWLFIASLRLVLEGGRRENSRNNYTNSVTNLVPRMNRAPLPLFRMSMFCQRATDKVFKVCRVYEDYGVLRTATPKTLQTL